MSESEKIDASPQKEEEKEDKKPEEAKEEKKESKPEQMETEQEEEDKEGNKPEPDTKPEPVEESPKKVPKKRKKIVKVEEEEEEELPLGLLERPVVIESGKREKRKVERLSMAMSFNLHEKKKVDVPEGSGQKLGECPRIEYKIAHTKADDLKPIHRIMFSRAGTTSEIKRNIRQFCGFSFSKDDKEYEKRLASVSKLSVSGLKLTCDILDLEKTGIKDTLVQRVMEFLMCPSDSGRKPPAPKKRGRAPKGEKKERGVKRKRGEKKERKKRNTTKEDVESDEDEDDVDNDKEADEDGDVSEEESEEEVPKKKAKVDKPKPKKTEDKKENDKKEKKVNDKKDKKEKSVKKHEKKEARKKKVENNSDEDSEDSDDETLASKKSGPPNNDELRDLVKKILDGANLEEVTMKTVVKQVYAKYPDFDLSDKKDFIKSTVKQLIS